MTQKIAERRAQRAREAQDAADAETRREEMRRLVWSCVTLIAGYTSFTAASNPLPTMDLFLMDAANVSALLCFVRCGVAHRGSFVARRLSAAAPSRIVHRASRISHLPSRIAHLRICRPARPSLRPPDGRVVPR